MASLINDLENDKKKRTYQSFSVEIGIGKNTVLIPIEEAERFESEVEKCQPQTTKKLRTIVEQFDGVLQK